MSSLCQRFANWRRARHFLRRWKHARSFIEACKKRAQDDPCFWEPEDASLYRYYAEEMVYTTGRLRKLGYGVSEGRSRRLIRI